MDLTINGMHVSYVKRNINKSGFKKMKTSQYSNTSSSFDNTISSQIHKNYAAANVSFKGLDEFGGCLGVLAGGLVTLSAGVGTPIYIYKDSMNSDIEKINIEAAERTAFIEDIIRNEKEFLTQKDMSSDEFMEKLNDLISQNKIQKCYEGQYDHEQREMLIQYVKKKQSILYDTPVFIKIMREEQRELFNSMNKEEKERIYDVRNFLMNTVNETLKDEISMGAQAAGSLKKESINGIFGVLLGTGLGVMHGSENIDSEYAKEVQEKALVVVSVLQKLSEADITINTGGSSEDAYGRAVNNMTRLYFSMDGMPIDPSYTVLALKKVRDKIANEMTPEQKANFDKKYDTKLEEFNELIEAYKKEKEPSKAMEIFWAILSGVMAFVGCGIGSILTLAKLREI